MTRIIGRSNAECRAKTQVQHVLGVRLKAGEKFADFRRIKCTNLAISLNTVGMEQKKSVNARLNSQEFDLIEKLRRQPRIMEQVQKILEIAQSSEGPLKTA